VEDDLGRDLALSIARSMVMVVKRPGTQVQVSPQLAAQASARDVIQEVCEYVLGSLNADLSVQTLADRACMSTRNFSRVFRRETNFTPGEFVEMARLHAARCMLEDTTPHAMKMVAYRCGFETVNNMRRAFLRTLGVCPSDYRRRFEPTGQPASIRPPPQLSWREPGREAQGSDGGCAGVS
jgi:transcriptional regulator GlxA family with amidase domain